MPNWCNTTVKVMGSNRDLLKFIEFLIRCSKRNDVETDFNLWLGYLLIESGINTKEEVLNNKTKYECRGQIYDLSVEDILEGDEGSNTAYAFYQDEEHAMPYFVFSEDTAWGPMLAMLPEIFKRLDIELDITYWAEEPGMELYWTNESKDLYYFNDTDFGGYCDHYLHGETVAKLLQLRLETDEENIDILVKMANEFEEDGKRLYVNKFKFVEVCETA